jgi:hypothetical protein
MEDEKMKQFLPKLTLACCLLVVSVDTSFGSPDIVIGPVVNPANNHIYYLLEQSTWTDAESKAVELGGHLATINDQAENDWVYSTFLPYAGSTGDKSQGDLWIGYTDAGHEGLWEWVSDEDSTFVNWTSIEPNGGTDENYGMIWGPYWQSIGIVANIPGQWNDLGNYDTFYWNVTPWGLVEVATIPAPSALLLGCVGVALISRFRKA